VSRGVGRGKQNPGREARRNPRVAAAPPPPGEEEGRSRLVRGEYADE